jgi:hypothetical protein
MAQAAMGPPASWRFFFIIRASVSALCKKCPLKGKE